MDCTRLPTRRSRLAAAVASAAVVTGLLAPAAAAADAPAPPDPEGTTAVEHLSALLTGAWERIDAVEPRTARAAAGIVATYVQWHLERAVRSLNLVERS